MLVVMQGAHPVMLEVKLPYVGINRIRFLGCLSTGRAGTPACYLNNCYLISSSLISYKRFQYLPVR